MIASRRIARALVAAIVLGFLWPCSLGRADQGGRPEAASLGLPETVGVREFQQTVEGAGLGPIEDLMIGQVTTSYYPLTEQVLYHAKITNSLDGRFGSVSFDAVGQMADAQMAVGREEQARRDKYGKLEPSLHAAVSSSGPESQQGFPVAIWLAMPAPEVVEDRPVWLSAVPHALGAQSTDKESRVPQSSGGLDRPSGLGLVPSSGQILATLGRESARVQTQVAAIVSPLCAYLVGQGWTVDYASAYVPVVHATLSSSAILAVEQLPTVTSIALLRPAQNAMDVASRAANAHWVWDEGYSGLGVKVGVIEVGGRAAVDNPYLRGVLQDEQNVPAEAASHATAVSGMLRGRHGDYRGIGYGALVRVGGATGGDISQLRSPAERAIVWGARVLNNSWGTSAYIYTDDPSGRERMNDQEKYWDSLINLHRVTVCFAAGNEGDAHGFLRHPAYAYNMISVGAYDDRNTERWSDDGMAAFSSYKDCASAYGDREKPELAAPGVAVYATITRSPWVGSCGNGTSYASPVVAGGVALLMQQTPELYAWPEAVKAILMASAWNNIEDNNPGDWAMGGRDGAGGVDLYEAMYVARLRHWGAGEWTVANFDAQGYTYIPIDLPAAAKGRGVIVWSVDPGYANYFDQPQVDLDLDWRMPDGSIITRSESYDNNFEVVWANNVTGGRRYLGVRAERFDPGVRIRVAWAWDWRSE